MKVLSLFSGVGGFDLGLERAGMRTVFQCELDPHANKVLEQHWPDVPRWGDISTLTGAHVLQHAPVIDVVAWGSPCQDLSLAGKRAGLGGERSGLFHEGVRIIKEIREITNGKYPRISIWENVAGALSSSDGADFGQVLYEMDEAGACFSEWRLLDAQYFGVPQRRRRVFLVSVFDPATAARCPDPLLPVSESLRRDIETSAATREEPAGTVAQGFGSGSEPLTLTKSKRAQTVDDNEPTIGFSHTQGLSAQPSETASPTLRSEGAGHAVAYTMRQREGKPGGGKGPLISEEKSLTLAANTNDQTIFQYDGYNQKINDTDVSVTLRLGRYSSDFVAQPVDAAGFKAGQGAGAGGIGFREGQAQTLTSDMNGLEPTVLTPTMAVRRLTPVECERLMGWPDGWTDGQADTHRYKQCGNGVASPVAQWIGGQLMRVLDNGSAID